VALHDARPQCALRLSLDKLGMTEGALSVRGLIKRFDAKVAIDDLSFGVARGEIVALLGPNGAGKSTTFACLAGLMRPDAGTIAFEGRVLESDRGRTVAVIPETPDVYPMLTVWEHLVFVARLCRLDPGWETRGEELLARFAMLDERNTVGNALSKGMRQKTLIAATVLAGTPVLLLDEPMIGLDPRGQRELREMLGELRSGGTALMISTHQLEAAEALSDRVIVLNHGKLVTSGTIADLRAQGSGTLEDIFLDITGS
jgi:ABC-2 type transport system ATP-binding protein